MKKCDPNSPTARKKSLHRCRVSAKKEKNQGDIHALRITRTTVAPVSRDPWERSKLLTIPFVSTQTDLEIPVQTPLAQACQPPIKRPLAAEDPSAACENRVVISTSPKQAAQRIAT
jgi:hypothetical protein